MAAEASSAPPVAQSDGHDEAVPPITSGAGPESVATSAPEVDFSDMDSAVGDMSRPNSTSSLHPSVYDFVAENGRTYHRFHDGKYLIPNDESEMDRLDLQNHIWMLTLEGKLHFAPLPDLPQRVLDIGTGTGIWAINFAQKYPSANVIGSDLSPIQPDLVPPNCHFEIDDAEDEWAYGQPFQYIHGRTLMNCFKDIRTIFAKAYDNLSPGGYFEMQDGCLPFRCADGTLEGTALLEWCSNTLSGSAAVGRTWADPRNYKSIMKSVGFVDVTETRLKWPLNAWPKDKKLKELGTWVCEDMMQILPAVKRVYTLGLGWDVEQADAFIEKAQMDLRSRQIHAWTDIVVVYGKRP